VAGGFFFVGHFWHRLIKNRGEKKMIKCKECGSEIVLPNDVVENEIIDCEACGIELEVVSLKPLEVDLAPEEQEDWGE
tara:strand:+ start:429 stop:662 length:234 start_codon:yes stop_codon:yes gene_type:complete